MAPQGLGSQTGVSRCMGPELDEKRRPQGVPPSRLGEQPGVGLQGFVETRRGREALDVWHDPRCELRVEEREEEPVLAVEVIPAPVV